MGDRKDFSQTELLKYLITALDKKLNLHHRDGRSDNNSYKNIAIYCDDHHNVIEERDKTKSELR